MVYTLKYQPDRVKYEMSAYIQRILDDDEPRPSIFRFCAQKLNMRVSELQQIAEDDAEIGELLSTLLSHVESYVTDAMVNGDMDVKVGQQILRQSVFGWRDRSAEPIRMIQQLSYDEATRSAILSATTPEEIMAISRANGLD